MKKIALIFLLCVANVAAFDRSLYEGASLAEFKIEDIELRNVLSQSSRDLFVANAVWYIPFVSPSQARLARIDRHIEILRGKYKIIDNTLNKAKAKLADVKKRKGILSGGSANPGAKMAGAVLFAPWIVGEQLFKEHQIRKQRRAIKSIKIARQQVRSRIDRLEKVVQYYR